MFRAYSLKELTHKKTDKSRASVTNVTHEEKESSPVYYSIKDFQKMDPEEIKHLVIIQTEDYKAKLKEIDIEKSQFFQIKI